MEGRRRSEGKMWRKGRMEVMEGEEVKARSGGSEGWK